MPVSVPFRRDQWVMFGKLLAIATVMFGFGYALVPMYRHICTALGINVLSLAERGGEVVQAVPANTQVDLGRTVTVEFDANVQGLWAFRPEVRSLDVHPGQLTTVMYEFTNTQPRTLAAQAIANYAPQVADRYFEKLQCFCFNEYTLKPGETRRWPVVFYLDPRLPREVNTITLSYTFFEVGGKVRPAPGSGT
ncbi:cytochrome c oxidase assembly protein [Ideonella benzenivorans]|uniref:cytochrome c oxidase assembly protein n=1 Tax=Ideonella benzenivorans TaxID=2831643 RepID=UPI001CED5697|nr:cytochrome c oxidase assembly protein [Ideonella benzenivorans]